MRFNKYVSSLMVSPTSYSFSASRRCAIYFGRTNFGFQRSHPSPVLLCNRIKGGRAPPIVRILQYHSGVVGQVRAESPHSFRVHGIYSSDLVLSDEGTDARAARVTFASFLDSNRSCCPADIRPNASCDLNRKSN